MVQLQATVKSILDPPSKNIYINVNGAIHRDKNTENF